MPQRPERRHVDEVGPRVDVLAGLVVHPADVGRQRNVTNGTSARVLRTCGSLTTFPDDRHVGLVHPRHLICLGPRARGTGGCRQSRHADDGRRPASGRRCGPRDEPARGCGRAPPSDRGGQARRAQARAPVRSRVVRWRSRTGLAPVPRSSSRPRRRRLSRRRRAMTLRAAPGTDARQRPGQRRAARSPRTNPPSSIRVGTGRMPTRRRPRLGQPQPGRCRQHRQPEPDRATAARASSHCSRLKTAHHNGHPRPQRRARSPPGPGRRRGRRRAGSAASATDCAHRTGSRSRHPVAERRAWPARPRTARRASAAAATNARAPHGRRLGRCVDASRCPPRRCSGAGGASGSGRSRPHPPGERPAGVRRTPPGGSRVRPRRATTGTPGGAGERVDQLGVARARPASARCRRRPRRSRAGHRAHVSRPGAARAAVRPATASAEPLLQLRRCRCRSRRGGGEHLGDAPRRPRCSSRPRSSRHCRDRLGGQPVGLVEHHERHRVVPGERREVVVVQPGVGVLLRVGDPDEHVDELEHPVGLDAVRHAPASRSRAGRAAPGRPAPEPPRGSRARARRWCRAPLPPSQSSSADAAVRAPDGRRRGRGRRAA